MSEHKSPLVSVLVTTYNSAWCIGDNLKSVLDQSMPEFEVIIIDDASTDGTVPMAEKILNGKCAYRIERLSENMGGPAGPRNLGVRIARGAWVALLDSDDMWHPQKLEVQLRVAQGAQAAFVSSEKRWFLEASETFARADEDLQVVSHPLRQVSHSQLRRKNFLCTSSVMAKRELLVKHPFVERSVYRAVEDYRCWLDIHRESIDVHPQIQTPLVFYRISGKSISKSKAKMVIKHWRLYRDYFAGGPWSATNVLTSMATYTIASLYRQVRYRSTRC